MKKTTLFALSLLIAVNVVAGVDHQTNLTIEKIRSLGDQTGKVIAFQATSNIVPEGLNCLSDFYTVEEGDNPELALSLLLTALTTGKTVELYVYNNKCSITGRISVRDVRILK